MTSHASLLVRAALAATLLLGARGTYAADQLVLGKKLLIKNPLAGTTANKVVHLSKDAAVTIGAAGSAGDPQCTGATGGGASSLRVAASGGAGDVTIPLPCGGWTTNAANSLYKYTDTTGATCRLVLVKGGVLVKAVCGGPQVAIGLTGGMSPVAVVTTLNTEAYCTEFGGTAVRDGSDHKTFLRKDALPPAACPTTTTTTSTIPPIPTTTTSTIPPIPTTTTSTISTCAGNPDCGVNVGDPCCEQAGTGLLFCCNGPCLSPGVCGSCGGVGEPCCAGNNCNGGYCFGGYCSSDPCGPCGCGGCF